MKKSLVILIVMVILVIVVFALWAFKIIPASLALPVLVVLAALCYGALVYANYDDNILGGKFNDHFKDKEDKQFYNFLEFSDSNLTKNFIPAFYNLLQFLFSFIVFYSFRNFNIQNNKIFTILNIKLVKVHNNEQSEISELSLDCSHLKFSDSQKFDFTNSSSLD